MSNFLYNMNWVIGLSDFKGVGMGSEGDWIWQKGLNSSETFRGLPPPIIITDCDISKVLSMSTNKRLRKAVAAAIILGQPFNRGRKS